MKNPQSTDFWEDLKSGRFASMVKETSKGQSVSNSQEVYNIMKPVFVQNDDIEACYCLFLDAKNKILAIEKMFSGSICSAAIYPREILKSLFGARASSMVMVHNHPSGDPTPSAEDKAITVKVGFALASVDAFFHDHLIVGNGFFSMADSGWLQRISRQFKDVMQADYMREEHGQN
jgi:DNA repair protein RadC